MIIDKDSKENKVERDIKRSIILSKYINYWGIPEFRTIINREEDNTSIEVYYFPAVPDVKIVSRLATVGISDSTMKNNGQRVNYELMMILPPDFAGAELNDVQSYFFSIITSSLELKEEIYENFIFSETKTAPKEWKTKALLVDTPRWDAEELERFHVGMQYINLYIAIPIYINEYNLIKMTGIEAFMSLCDASEFSVIDMSRDSFVL
jgi:hypothetical protein